MVKLSLVDNSVDDIDAAHRYDIEESFKALDVHRTGRLTTSYAFMILLSLGYLKSHKTQDAFTPSMLEEIAEKNEKELQDGNDDDGIKLDTLLTIVATVRLCVKSVCEQRVRMIICYESLVRIMYTDEPLMSAMTNDNKLINLFFVFLFHGPL